MGAQNLTPGALWDQSDKDYTNFPTKEKQTEKSAGNGKDEERKKEADYESGFMDRWHKGAL